MGNRRAVLEQLASIADGEPGHVNGALPPEAGARSLRVIAGVAAVHRTLGNLDASDPGRATLTVAMAASSPDLSGPPPATPSMVGARWGGLQLEKRLGEGAFGEVFEAHDPRLARQVALKLLKPRDAADEHGQYRLLAEARSLARVKSDYVVKVYGADIHDGRVGMWMEIVRGSTLQRVVEERGVLGAREAAIAGQELCLALSAVHGAGIVHGDVKAQNVVREIGGRHVLMDFGAGRSPHASRSRPRAGTPLYLAPEVLDGGAPTVAGDIYSLGVLLYYLVTARYPVTATTLPLLRAEHRRGRVSRLHDIRPNLSDGFVRAVERAIAPDPAQRYSSAGEMQAALGHVLGTIEPATRRHPAAERTRPIVFTWPWAGVLATSVVLVLVALAVLAASLKTPPLRQPDSLAVLPFRHIGAAQDRYFTDGIADEIAARLSEIAGPVRIVSTSSARRLGHGERPVAEIGRELHAGMLVAGSVQVVGDRLVIVAELLDAATSTQLWGRRFSRIRQQAFELHADVAQGIAAAIDTSPTRARGVQHRMASGAFDLYLKGRFYWSQRTRDGLARSVEYFGQASQADPASALPWAGLASAHALLAIYRVDWPGEAYARAEAAALKAIALEPGIAEPHAALGLVQKERHRWQDAATSLLRAIEINDGYASAHHWLGVLRAQQGRFDIARAEIRKAQELEPLSLVLGNAAGYIELTSRQFDAALAQYQQVIELDPSNLEAYIGLAETYAALGSADRARAALAMARRVGGRPSYLNLPEAYAYARAGRTAESRRVLAVAVGRVDREPTSAGDIAAVYAALGQRDVAFEWLDRAMRTDDPLTGYVLVDPKFDPLRTDPRFQRVLTNLGLDAEQIGR